MKAALASLHDQTVRVAVVQDKAAKSADNLEQSTTDLAKADEKATKASVTKRAELLRASDLEGRVRAEREKTVKVTQDEAAAIVQANEARVRDAASRKAQFALLQQQAKDRLRNNDMLVQSERKLMAERQRLDAIMADGAKRWAAIEDGRAVSSERAARRIERAQGGGGGGGRGKGLFGSGFPSNPLDFGRRGLKPQSVGIAALIGGGIGLVKPLENLMGLIGALPAVAGAAGIALVAFHAMGAKAISKAAADQAKATAKFQAGTITAKAYQKAMTNALVGLSAEQQKALPFYVQWHDMVLKVSDSIQHKMLPALGKLGEGLKANKASIIGAFGMGAGSLAAGMTGIGSFLQTRRGQAGTTAFASSSANMLSGFSAAAVNLFKSFLDVARAAQPLVNRLANDMTRVTAKFAAFTGSFSGQQRMRQWFLDGEVAAKKFFAVIGNVGMAIHNLAGGVGTGFLDWLVGVTEKFQQWTQVQGNVDKVSAAVKRLADTLMVIGQAAGGALTHLAKFADVMTRVLGPNTLGWLMMGRAVGGGAVLKGLGKGIGGKLFGGAAAGAAGGAAAGGGGLLAGLGGAAALTPIIAGIGVAAVALTGLYLLTTKMKGGVDSVAAAWTVVAANIRAAASAAAGVAKYQALRGQQKGVGGQIPQARLALFDAKQGLATDKQALKGLSGKDATRMRIQIEVDQASVTDARAALAKVRGEFETLGKSAIDAAHDQRGAAIVAANAATSQVAGLERATDAAHRNTAAIFRQGAGFGSTSAATNSFIASMQGAAKSLAAADPKAARFARTAARLAQEIGHIPTSREVNIQLKGEGQIESGLKRIAGLIAQIHDKNVVIALQSITPVGRPAPGSPPAQKGSHGTAMAGTRVDSPMTIVGEQAPLHPEFVIATNPAYRARNQKLMGEAAKSMGGEVNFFAQGGVMSGGTAMAGFGIGTGPNRLPPARPDLTTGIAAALGLATAYGAGDQNAAGLAAAAKYAAIPGRIGDLKHQMAALHNQIKREDTWLEHEDDLLVKMRHQMTAEKDKGKKARIKSQIDKIVHDTIPAHKQTRKTLQGKVKGDQKLIDDLTAELQDLVPGEASFQDLIATIEGQSSAASELHRDDLVKALEAKEILDYQKRIEFLTAFTRVPSTTRNRTLFAAASAALGSDKSALDALVGAASDSGGGTGSGGSGSGDAASNGDKDQALAMLADLAKWAREGQLSDLIGADQLGVAMDFISKTVGSFAKGSPFIAKGGLAQVHYGEAIVPAWQNKQSTAPSEATLTLQGSDDLTRALAKALGTQVNIQLGRETRRRVREGVRS